MTATLTPRRSRKLQERINCLRRMLNITAQKHRRLSKVATTHEQRMELRRLSADMLLLDAKLDDLLSR